MHSGLSTVTDIITVTITDGESEGFHPSSGSGLVIYVYSGADSSCEKNKQSFNR